MYIMAWLLIGLMGGYVARRLGEPATYDKWYDSYREITGWRVQVWPGERALVATVFWAWLFLWPVVLIVYSIAALHTGISRFNRLLEPCAPTKPPLSERPCEFLLEAQKEVDELVSESQRAPLP